MGHPAGLLVIAEFFKVKIFKGGKNCNIPNSEDNPVQREVDPEIGKPIPRWDKIGNSWIIVTSGKIVNNGLRLSEGELEEKISILRIYGPRILKGKPYTCHNLINDVLYTWL